MLGKNGEKYPRYLHKSTEASCKAFSSSLATEVVSHKIPDDFNRPFVVGGVDAELSDYTFMALLGFDYRDRIVYTCGGSVINKFYVLTAAHCNEASNPIRYALTSAICKPPFYK